MFAHQSDAPIAARRDVVLCIQEQQTEIDGSDLESQLLRNLLVGATFGYQIDNLFVFDSLHVYTY
jgi:F0F1-type ATP synthase assembly protein I